MAPATPQDVAHAAIVRIWNQTRGYLGAPKAPAPVVVFVPKGEGYTYTQENGQGIRAIHINPRAAKQIASSKPASAKAGRFAILHEFARVYQNDQVFNNANSNVGAGVANGFANRVLQKMNGDKKADPKAYAKKHFSDHFGKSPRKIGSGASFRPTESVISPDMERKQATLVEVKANSDGAFTALASVFGNVDRGGDRVMPGAFTNVLSRLRDIGDPIPVVLSHQHNDPMAIIGKADPSQVTETDAGLQVDGKLDLSNPLAKQVHSLMKERVLKGWSFAYTVAKGGQEMKDGVNEIKEIGDLFEVGPTLIGMNPEAQTQAVKSLIQELEAEETDDEDVEEHSDEEPQVAKSQSQEVRKIKRDLMLTRLGR